jgi:hypothetical protein
MATKVLSIEQLITKADQEEGNTLTANELGRLADRWWEVKQERLLADKAAAKLKGTESTLEKILIDQQRAQEINGIGGKVVRVGWDEKQVPHVTDWPKFYAHIQETGEFDLLERRPGKAACGARWEDGKDVPGVEKFPVYSLTKQGVK